MKCTYTLVLTAPPSTLPPPQSRSVPTDILVLVAGVQNCILHFWLSIDLFDDGERRGRGKRDEREGEEGAEMQCVCVGPRERNSNR